jgi:leucyl-tRNA synthetase
MSTSKNPGVDPQVLIERYGADTVRFYTMFTAPPDKSLEWSDDAVEGAARFLRRLWSLCAQRQAQLRRGPGDLSRLGDAAQAARREIHEALRKALYDYDRQQYNTVASACMSIVNTLGRLGEDEDERAVLHEGLGVVLRLLAPITPHVTHVLWRDLGFGADVLDAGWPAVDAAALQQATVEYVVQVNGKLRGRLPVPAGADQAAVEQAALEDANVRRFVGEATVRKVIVVPRKLVNIVTT